MIDILEDVRGGLAVSCQAAEDSPPHQTHHIVALARATVTGGAKAVRIEAEISALQDASKAMGAGADFVGTTLSGYTPCSPQDTRLRSNARTIIGADPIRVGRTDLETFGSSSGSRIWPDVRRRRFCHHPS